jgi:hypothetical protein
MELFEISVGNNNGNHHFEIRDYMHHDGVQCKYEVYEKGVFIASFEPGPRKHLQLCKNAGIEKEELLNQIADQLETYNL